MIEIDTRNRVSLSFNNQVYVTVDLGEHVAFLIGNVVE